MANAYNWIGPQSEPVVPNTRAEQGRDIPAVAEYNVPAIRKTNTSIRMPNTSANGE